MNMDANPDTDTNTKDICNSGNSRITRLGDTYAIEIKPKQGWLQLPSDVSDLFDLMPAGDATKDDTTTAITALRTTHEPAKVRPMGQPLLLTPNRCWCRYCSMQHVKLQTGKIKRLGDYCPLQLFSGTPRRMLDALNALFACPQNNLRVFQNGNLIYGDHANSISCEELHSRVFPGEIMVLIKHLLVACLLREYNNSSTKEVKTQSQRRSGNHSHVAGAAFGESPCEPFAGMKTKETTAIGVANVDAAAAAASAAWHVENLKQVQKEDREQEQEEAKAGIVEFVIAVDGQPQQRRCKTAAAAEKPNPKYTKRTKIATSTTTTTTTTTTIAPTTCLSTNVAIAVTRTEAKTETGTMATAMASTSKLTSNPKATQAQINNAEIFHLPNNCVLQKILHLQLLVKQHFHYMWQQGYAQHETPSYQALRGLLNCSKTFDLDELPPEQAYMLGATALDCSIMLTFQEIRCPIEQNSSLQPWLVCVKDRQFLTKLSILDLDPKPDSHYHKFIKHTREIEKFCPALN